MNLLALKQFHVNIKIRMVVSFVSDIAEMSIFPFMAMYFSSNLGITWAGAILTLTTIASIVFGMYGGSFADRFGRKKVMVAGSMVQTVAFVIIALANSPWFESVWLTFVMFFLLSITSRFIDPASEALLIDVSSEEEQPLMYRFIYWSTNLAFSIGIILGGLLFLTHKFELFFGFAILSIFTFLLTLVWIQDDYVPKNEQMKNGFMLGFISVYTEVLKDARFMILCVSTLLILSLEFQLYGFIAVRLSEDIHTSIFGITIDGPKMLSILIITNTMLVILAWYTWEYSSKNQYKIYVVPRLVYVCIGVQLLSMESCSCCVNHCHHNCNDWRNSFPANSINLCSAAGKQRCQRLLYGGKRIIHGGRANLRKLRINGQCFFIECNDGRAFLLIGGLGILGFFWSIRDSRLKTTKEIA